MSSQDVLVVAEIQRGMLVDVTGELLAAARAITAAAGGEVVALVLSDKGAAYAPQLGAADRIVLVDDPQLAAYAPAAYVAALESYFTEEYGWPRYSEYHHALAPHDGSLTHSDRVRAAEAFSQKFIAVVGKPLAGSLPPRQGFLSMEPKNLHLQAFRKKPGPGSEIRVTEVEGKQGPATITMALPMANACETNLLGKKIASVACHPGKLNFESKSWKVQTFEIA